MAQGDREKVLARYLGAKCRRDYTRSWWRIQIEVRTHIGKIRLPITKWHASRSKAWASAAKRLEGK